MAIIKNECACKKDASKQEPQLYAKIIKEQARAQEAEGKLQEQVTDASSKIDDIYNRSIGQDEKIDRLEREFIDVKDTMAHDDEVVHNTGDESISGNKHFVTGYNDAVSFGVRENIWDVKIDAAGIKFSDYDGGYLLLGREPNHEYIGARNFAVERTLCVDGDIELGPTTLTGNDDAVEIKPGVKTPIVYTDALSTGTDVVTAQEIKEAVGNIDKLKIYTYLPPVEDQQDRFVLPKNDTEYTVLAMTAKGVADSVPGILLEDITIEKQGNTTKLIENLLPTMLYKTGFLKDMLTDNYAYDRFDLVNSRIERHVSLISVYDLIVGNNLTWSWSKSSGNGRLSINHTLISNKFKVMSANGFGYEKIMSDYPAVSGLEPKGISTVNFAIDNWNDVGTFTKFIDVKDYVSSNKDWFKNCFILFKALEPTMTPVYNKFNNKIMGSADESEIVSIINYGGPIGQMQISYMSLNDLMYTKDQIDDKFYNKSYFSDKVLIYRLADKVATSELFNSLLSGYVNFANFSNGNDGSVPFNGPTLFVQTKTSDGEKGFEVFSNGTNYVWTKDNISSGSMPAGGNNDDVLTKTLIPAHYEGHIPEEGASSQGKILINGAGFIKYVSNGLIAKLSDYSNSRSFVYISKGSTNVTILCKQYGYRNDYSDEFAKVYYLKILSSRGTGLKDVGLFYNPTSESIYTRCPLDDYGPVYLSLAPHELKMMDINGNQIEADQNGIFKYEMPAVEDGYIWKSDTYSSHEATEQLNELWSFDDYFTYLETINKEEWKPLNVKPDIPKIVTMATTTTSSVHWYEGVSGTAARICSPRGEVRDYGGAPVDVLMDSDKIFVERIYTNAEGNIENRTFIKNSDYTKSEGTRLVEFIYSDFECETDYYDEEKAYAINKYAKITLTKKSDGSEKIEFEYFSTMYDFEGYWDI